MKRYKRIHPLIDKLIFVNNTNSNEFNKDAIEKIKQCLIKIMLEVSNNEYKCKKSVEPLITECLLCLLNNFLGVSVDIDKKFTNQNKYKEDILQIERIQRIMVLTRKK